MTDNITTLRAKTDNLVLEAKEFRQLAVSLAAREKIGAQADLEETLFLFSSLGVVARLFAQSQTNLVSQDASSHTFVDKAIQQRNVAYVALVVACGKRYHFNAGSNSFKQAPVIIKNLLAPHEQFEVVKSGDVNSKNQVECNLAINLRSQILLRAYIMLRKEEPGPYLAWAEIFKPLCCQENKIAIANIYFKMLQNSAHATNNQPMKLNAKTLVTYLNGLDDAERQALLPSRLYQLDNVRLEKVVDILLERRLGRIIAGHNNLIDRQGLRAEVSATARMVMQR